VGVDDTTTFWDLLLIIAGGFIVLPALLLGAQALWERWRG
jgi:hypothetical protein